MARSRGQRHGTVGIQDRSTGVEGRPGRATGHGGDPEGAGRSRVHPGLPDRLPRHVHAHGRRLQRDLDLHGLADGSVQDIARAGPRRRDLRSNHQHRQLGRPADHQPDALHRERQGAAGADRRRFPRFRPHRRRHIRAAPVLLAAAGRLHPHRVRPARRHAPGGRIGRVRPGLRRHHERPHRDPHHRLRRRVPAGSRQRRREGLDPGAPLPRRRKRLHGHAHGGAGTTGLGVGLVVGPVVGPIGRRGSPDRRRRHRDPVGSRRRRGRGGAREPEGRRGDPRDDPIGPDVRPRQGPRPPAVRLKKRS
mmetsp:Transcript_19363/g.45029  ORF Transcript_19363/g.45029 Transcript_19363/m.45029 type:complete len:306 (+) Transcript_19363:422-1339(+)